MVWACLPALHSGSGLACLHAAFALYFAPSRCVDLCFSTFPFLRALLPPYRRSLRSRVAISYIRLCLRVCGCGVWGLPRW